MSFVPNAQLRAETAGKYRFSRPAGSNRIKEDFTIQAVRPPFGGVPGGGGAAALVAEALALVC
jgi:hypothetical protein